MIKTLKQRGFLKQVLNFQFSDNRENKSSHIFISQEHITEKAKQVSRIPLRKEVSLFTDAYFKEKGDHMRISNIALEPRVSASMITGIGPGVVEANGATYNTPIIITNNMIYVWEVDDVHNITPDHFIILEHLLPDFKYAVVGLGEEKIELNQNVKKYFDSLKKKVDNVDWFLACSAFNNCMENDIEAVGFFYV